MVLRCSVAANPLAQNTILQIEWHKDGKKLSAGPSVANAASQRQLEPRIQIEKANHLHMPLSQSGQLSQVDFASGLPRQQQSNQNQLAANSKLIGSSTLTVSALSKSDSGLYSCHFKLIPAPINGASNRVQTQQQQQQIKITSGRANQTMHVIVIEGKWQMNVYQIKLQFSFSTNNNNTDDDICGNIWI